MPAIRIAEKVEVTMRPPQNPTRSYRAARARRCPGTTGARRAPALFAATVALLTATAAAALSPGDAAPSFTAPSLDGGESLSLRSLRGKVVFVDFWASWCGPCLTSLPLLDDLRREFPSERFQVLAVNVDRDPDKARAFLERRPVGYPSATDPQGRIPESFGVETMPTSYLIDARGVVRLVNEGFRVGDIPELRANIQALLRGAR